MPRCAFQPFLTTDFHFADGCEAVNKADGEREGAARQACQQYLARRREQRLAWVRSLVEEEVLSSFRRDPRVAEMLPELERQVVAGERTEQAIRRKRTSPIARNPPKCGRNGSI